MARARSFRTVFSHIDVLSHLIDVDHVERQPTRFQLGVVTTDAIASHHRVLSRGCLWHRGLRLSRNARGTRHSGRRLLLVSTNDCERCNNRDE